MRRFDYCTRCLDMRCLDSPDEAHRMVGHETDGAIQSVLLSGCIGGVCVGVLAWVCGRWCVGGVYVGLCVGGVPWAFVLSFAASGIT